MIKRQLFAIGLLAAAASLSCAAEAGKTDPESGKSCVAFFSSERNDAGLQLMHFRNICGTPFKIRIMAEGKTRAATIKAGTAKKASSATVTCKSSDSCDTAEWKYE